MKCLKFLSHFYRYYHIFQNFFNYKMLFDSYITILKHQTDDVTVELQLCPLKKRFLSLSPTSITLFFAHSIELRTLCIYHLPDELQQFGFFTHAAWLSGKSFAVQTSLGNILIFLVDDNNQIFSRQILKHLDNLRFTAITSYMGFMLAGDDHGNLTILSPQNGKIFSHKAINSSIKQIVISKTHGIIFGSDLSIMTFEINSDVLTKENIELHVTNLNLTPSLVAANPTSNLCVFYDPHGTLFITNFVNFSKTHTKIPKIFAITFSADGKHIYALCYGGIGIWSIELNRFRFIPNSDVNSGRAIAASGPLLVASITPGIISFPILSVSNFGFYGASRYYDIHIMKSFPQKQSFNGPYAIIRPLASNISEKIGPIRRASISPDGKFVAIAGSKVGILDRDSGKWSVPGQNDFTAKAIGYFADYLVVLSFNIPRHHNQLSFMNGFENNRLITKNIFSLPSRPINFSYDIKRCVITLENSIITIDHQFNQKTYGIQAISCSPLGDHLVCLSKDRKLFLDNPENQLIDEVESFFVDIERNLIFVVKGIETYVTSLDMNPISFEICCISEKLVSGVDSSNSALVLVDNSFPPFKVTFSHYFNPYLLKRFEMIQKDEELTPLEKEMIQKDKKVFIGTPSYPTSLIQIGTKLLQERRGKACLEFIKQFDFWEEILINLLRVVEDKEKKVIIPFIGSSSQFFASICNAEFSSDKKFSFVGPQNQNVEPRKIKVASQLLPIILSEEGPSIAIPAAIFILRNQHQNCTQIEPILRFLNHTIELDPQYKEEMNVAIEYCMVDLFSIGRVKTAFWFCEKLSIEPEDFLIKHPKIEDDLSKNQGTANLIESIINVQRKECKESYEEDNYGLIDDTHVLIHFLSIGWKKMALISHLSHEDFYGANVLIKENSELLTLINGTKYSEMFISKTN